MPCHSSALGVTVAQRIPTPLVRVQIFGSVRLVQIVEGRAEHASMIPRVRAGKNSE